MREDPHRPWKQGDLVAEIKRRHWIDPTAKQPEAAIRVAVRRLWEAGEVERVTTGVYRIKGFGTVLPVSDMGPRGLETMREEGVRDEAATH